MTPDEERELLEALAAWLKGKTGSIVRLKLIARIILNRANPL